MSEAVVSFEEGAARTSLLLFPFFSTALFFGLWRFTEIEEVGTLKLTDANTFLFMFMLFFEAALISYFVAFSFSTIPCVIGQCQNTGDPMETALAWTFVAGWPVSFLVYAALRATRTIGFGFVVFESGNSLVTNLRPKGEAKVAPQPVPTTTENPLGWSFTIRDAQ